MTTKTNRKTFIQAGDPVGLLGGDGDRVRRDGDALVVLPDERWGNPVFGDACLDESDFHVHAKVTLEQLAGTGVSVLLGGHYHYAQSRPDANLSLRICLDEDVIPAASHILDKETRIVYAKTNPRVHWSMSDFSRGKRDAGASSEFITPGEPFVIDIHRRGAELIFKINDREVFSGPLNDDTLIAPGRCGDAGWPISVGFLPGHGPLWIHDFYAEGDFPGPSYPTSDAWISNTSGYTHYRIPSLCHTKSGQLLAFTEARHARVSRNREWESDWVRNEIHCLLKRSDDDGETWSEQETVINRGVSYEPRDPSPVLDSETGEIFLVTGEGPWLISSKDDGRTWSEPRSLADSGPVEIKDFRPGVGDSAIQLRHGPFKGRLLLALSEKQNVAAVIYSDDHGETWNPGALAAFSGACEPSIVELSDGRVIVSPRIGPRVGPKATGRLFLTSEDGGVTFSDQRYETGIPIPGQGELVACESPEAAAAGGKRPIVFCGPADGKTNLTMLVSLDDGETWPISKVIDDGSAANLALIELPGGRVGVMYERDKYRRTSFQRVDLATLVGESR